MISYTPQCTLQSHREQTIIQGTLCSHIAYNMMTFDSKINRVVLYKIDPIWPHKLTGFECVTSRMLAEYYTVWVTGTTEVNEVKKS